MTDKKLGSNEFEWIRKELLKATSYTNVWEHLAIRNITKPTIIGWLKAAKKGRKDYCPSATDYVEIANAKKNAFNEALDKIEYTSEEPTFSDGWDAAIAFMKRKYWNG